MARLKDIYLKDGLVSLMEKYKYKNKMMIPKLEKITINMGLGEAIQNAKILEWAGSDIMKITGQKPIITKSKLAVSAFKLRKGMSIGCKVTLRSEKMYEFLDRLVNVALPRVKDFKGISKKAFDGRGNYTLGLKDQTIFPEIEYDKTEKVLGMNITFVTTAKTNDEARSLLEVFGMPFERKERRS
ncbi:MAG: 50S ribosomal protein L5 [Pseudomonadota bacterium]